MRACLAILTLSGAVALGGCTSDFHREAGASLDEGAFGNPTMNNIQVQTGERAMAVNLNRRFAAEAPTTITFEFDSAVLDGEARAALDRQAAWIRQYPNVRFRVYGHTDMVGPAAYNKSLGLRRARAAVNYLVSRGVPRSHLEAVVSYGETQPVIVTEGRERRNRRTVTEVWGFLESRRMIHDGKYMARTYGIYLGSAQEQHIPE